MGGCGVIRKMAVVFCAFALLLSASAEKFTRAVSASEISPGKQVSLIYTVTNDGKTDMLHVKVTDRAGNFSAGKDALAPGESVVFRSTVTVYASLVSNATLTFEDGDGPHAVTLDEKTVSAARIRPEASLVRSGDALTLTVRNAGRNSISRLSVYDGAGGLLTDGSVLPPGEEIAFSLVLPQRETYEVRVRAYDEGGSWEETAASCPGEPAADEGEPVLSIEAKAEYAALREPGGVNVTFTVRNEGGKAENIRLCDENGEELRALRVIPASSTVTCTERIEVREESEMRFALVDGEAVAARSNGVTVRITPDGARPLPDGEGEKRENAVVRYFGSDSVYISMLLGVLAVLVVILIAYRLHGAVRMRARIRRQEEDRYRAIMRRRLRKRKDVP